MQIRCLIFFMFFVLESRCCEGQFFVWDSELNFIEKVGSLEQLHSKRWPSDTLLVYSGNAIEDPEAYNFPYNPLTGYNRYADFFKVRQIDERPISEPKNDLLEDGYWAGYEFSDRHLIWEKSILNNLLDGDFVEYHHTGDVRMKSSFKDGWLVGEQRIHLQPGVLSATKLYIEKGEVSESRTFNDNGSIRVLFTLEMGLALLFDESGQLIAIEEVSNSMNNGKSWVLDEEMNFKLRNCWENGEIIDCPEK